MHLPNKERLKPIAFCSFIFLGGLTIGAVAFHEKNDQTIIATYKGGVISSADLGDYLMSIDISERYSDDLIEDKLIALEADRLNIHISKEEKDAIYNSILSNFGGQTAFDDYLAYYKVNEENLINQSVNELILEKIILKTTSYSTKDLKTYFEANKDKFYKAKSYDFSEIVVSDKNSADDIYKRLDQGEKFEELAEKLSETDSSKNKGRVGTTPADKLSDLQEMQLASLENGSYSGVFEDKLGFTIVKLNKKTEAKEVSFKDVKEDVEDAFLSELVSQNHAKWFEDAKKRYAFKKNTSA